MQRMKSGLFNSTKDTAGRCELAVFLLHAMLLQNPQYYGILRKLYTDGEFEVYSGFVCVNVGGPFYPLHVRWN